LMSAFFSLAVTNSYYYFYRVCTGSSMGVAFSLTFLYWPTITLVSFVIGRLARKLSSDKKLLFQISSMAVAWLLSWVVCMSFTFPIPEKENFGGCPRWLMHRSLEVDLEKPWF
jgi:hypothetical protein